MTWKIVSVDPAAAEGFQHRVIFVLSKGDRRVSIMSMSDEEYREVVKFVAEKVRKIAKDVIASKLGDLIWKDAVSVFDNDTDAAMKKLSQLEITNKKIESHADVLAMSLMTMFLDSLPEEV